MYILLNIMVWVSVSGNVQFLVGVVPMCSDSFCIFWEKFALIYGFITVMSFLILFMHGFSIPVSLFIVQLVYKNQWTTYQIMCPYCENLLTGVYSMNIFWIKTSGK
jgi:hypothetical protein